MLAVFIPVFAPLKELSCFRLLTLTPPTAGEKANESLEIASTSLSADVFNQTVGRTREERSAPPGWPGPVRSRLGRRCWDLCPLAFWPLHPLSRRSTRSAAALLVRPPSPLLNRYGRVVLLKVLRAAARK